MKYRSPNDKGSSFFNRFIELGAVTKLNVEAPDNDPRRDEFDNAVESETEERDAMRCNRRINSDYAFCDHPGDGYPL